MNIETKFKVNDFVYIRAQVKHYKEVLEPLIVKKDYISIGELEIITKRPPAFQIVERLIQTCPDGTQIHYRLRALATDALLQFLESELSSDFNY